MRPGACQYEIAARERQGRPLGQAEERALKQAGSGQKVEEESTSKMEATGLAMGK